jgi:hypothetical protein
MPQMGFEPTIPVFERAKTVDVLDRAATVIVVTKCVPKIVIYCTYAVNKIGKFI